MEYAPTSLLGLPVELRLQILEYTFAGTRVQLYHPSSKQYNRQTAYALLSANRQLRTEAHPLFYAFTQFYVRDGFTDTDLAAWLHAIGPPAVASLDWLSLCCREKCSMYGLQPDTDYCHRAATLRRGGHGAEYYLVVEDYCSNRAYGCETASHMEHCCLVGCSLPRCLDIHSAEPILLSGDNLAAEDVVGIFRALSQELSSSVA